MKNYIPATFLLTLIVVGVLMGLYFLPSMSVGGKPLRKVDLLADIRPDVEEEVCDSDTHTYSKKRYGYQPQWTVDNG